MKDLPEANIRIEPLYQRQVWLFSGILLFLLGCALQIACFLPLGYWLLVEFFAILIIYLAFFHFYEYLRLIDYEYFYIDRNGFCYQWKNVEKRVSYQEIDVSFLYYSSLDKKKGSATFCLRLKDGSNLRFSGVVNVDKLLIELQTFIRG